MGYYYNFSYFHWLRIIACKMSFYYVEQDDNICDQEGINLQDSFMRKKLALLSSGSAPCLHRMKGKEEMLEGWSLSLANIILTG